jgi:hypothetical protein
MRIGSPRKTRKRREGAKQREQEDGHSLGGLNPQTRKARWNHRYLGLTGNPQGRCKDLGRPARWDRSFDCAALRARLE